MEKWSQAEIIGTWIVIAILVISLFAILVIKLFFLNYRRSIKEQLIQKQLQLDYQEKMLQVSIEIQEQERSRIAADIHDSLIGKMTTLRLTNSLNPNSDNLEEGLRDCISDARRISHDLMPPLIQYACLDLLIDQMLNPWRNFHVINFHKIGNSISLESDFKLQIIRILQELIVNIHKHADCKMIDLNLRFSLGFVSLIVRDDGVGFDMGQTSSGIGLNNIEHRVSYLNGKYKIKSGIGGTTFIFLFLI